MPKQKSKRTTRSAKLKPTWRPAERALYLDGLLVKRLDGRAKNQQLILAAFQELGWPQRIDDPLPPDGKVRPKVRLHYTIQRLNRCQQNQLIHFGGDGTGRGIRWWLTVPK